MCGEFCAMRISEEALPKRPKKKNNKKH